MPITQRARLVATGWDEDLTIETSDEGPAAPSRDQVRIEVEACGVCYRDCIDRAGRFKFIRIPITPGHEVVGRVTAVGPDATDWSVGDRVAALHRDYCGRCPACESGEHSACSAAAGLPGLVIDGGYATTMLAPQRGFYRMPESISAEHAAVLHCTYGTAFRGLRRAGIRSGQHVLVTGANGGVGVAAVQVATRLGARVTAVVRDEAHRDFLTELGAAHVVVSTDGKFHKQLPAGLADIAIDCVGEPTFNASLRSLRPGGSVVVIGNVTPDQASLNLGYIVTRGLHILGSSGATRADMAELVELYTDAPFAIQIDETVPLTDADRAQRRVRTGGLHGRIVIVPTPPATAE